MAETSTIEWTDSTWNPITGCTLVSEGCRHCYAATLAATRLKNHPSRAGLARVNAAGEAKFTGKVRFNEQWLDQPLRWRRPRMIFVCAHGDLFHEAVPDEWIDQVFAVMALAPHHTFQVLTKRPERARAYLDGCSSAPEAKGFVGTDWTTLWHRRAGVRQAMLGLSCRGHRERIGKVYELPLPNLWLGTSVEDQAAADERIPHLLAAPAAVRFLSAEPLLGPMDLLRTLARWQDNPQRQSAVPLGAQLLDWVIVGGESGRGARPMHPDWARALRDQCAAAGVAYFFKQWGEWADAGSDLMMKRAEKDRLEGAVLSIDWNGAFPNVHDFDAASARVMNRVGKARAGRLLDGREHNEMPPSRLAQD